MRTEYNKWRCRNRSQPDLYSVVVCDLPTNLRNRELKTQDFCKIGARLLWAQGGSFTELDFTLSLISSLVPLTSHACINYLL
jgi:hypothetical protein